MIRRGSGGLWRRWSRDSWVWEGTFSPTYIYCRTATELLDLYERSSSGKLRSSIEQLFNELLLGSSFSTCGHQCGVEVTVDNLKDVIECALTQLLYRRYRSQIDTMTVTLTSAEYKKCRSYFSDEFIIMRAICDLDQSKISGREYDELKNTLHSLKMVEGEKINHPLYSMVLSFKKGDYMMTTTPTKISDSNDGWWKVEHLGSGRIGYIPRNCVVIDYSEEIRATSNNVGLLKRPATSRTTASSSTMINFLPLELLDIILQKSYLHCALNRDHHRRRRHHVYYKDESSDNDDEFVIIIIIGSLASVDRCWFERIMRKQRFKRIVRRRLSLTLNKIHRSIGILRSNQSFLEEKMQLCRSEHDHIINELRLCDCLTDVQSRLLSRQTVFISGKVKLHVSRRNNSSDLLSMISCFDDIRRSNFIRHLRRSNEKFITKVLDNGGVAVKMNLFGKDAGKLQRLSERLNDVNDKTKLRSEKIERVIHQLSKSDIEIISAQLDVRQIGLFIWCKSKLGLENLRKFCESNLFDDIIITIIGGLTTTTQMMTTTTVTTNSSASELIVRRMIDVDIEQFKRTTVVCPIVIRFSARLGVDEDEEVKGVTTLRQEIALLCRTDSFLTHTIRVFQNRNPFRLNAKIDISDVEDPEDIGSSKIDNCFYVVDSKQKCVWKIPRQTGDHYKFIQLQSTHFHWPSTLSMSRDGHQLLMLTSHSICIYGVGCGGGTVGASGGGEQGAGRPPQQEVSLFVRLPSYIEDPRHVVETSSGHFIVLHSVVKDVVVEQKKKKKKTTAAAAESKKEENEEDEEEKEKEKKEKDEDEEEEVEEVEYEEKTMKRMFVVSKLTRDGQLVVCRFVPQNKTRHQQQHQQQHQQHQHQHQHQHHQHHQQHEHHEDLNHPFYLAIDSDDRVFVADEGSDRVILLNSDLRFIRSLCSPTENEEEGGGRGIRMPKRLCYDEEHRQLVVAGFFRKEGANVYRIERL